MALPDSANHPSRSRVNVHVRCIVISWPLWRKGWERCLLLFHVFVSWARRDPIEGVGFAVAPVSVTPFHFALKKWDKKVQKWCAVHMPLTAKVHMVGVEIVPTLHHVFAIAEVTPDLLKKLNRDVLRVIGGKLTTSGRVSYTKVKRELLELPVKKGGYNLPNIERRAGSMLGKMWIQLVEGIKMKKKGQPILDPSLAKKS